MAGGGRDIRLARLFVDYESNAKGFQKDIEQNVKSLERLTLFIRTNPLAAMGALAAAAVAAGFKAAQMANQFDAAARKIAAVVPGATTKLGDLKRIADSLATSKGISSEGVLAGLSAIAREGVTDLDHLKARFDIVQRTVDATGASFDQVASGLDQALDVFGLADSELEKVAARLASVSEGRFPLEELFGALQASARTAKDSGISFDSLVGRLAKLVAEGKNAKQSASQLKDELALGRAAFEKLPRVTGDATAELARFNERADLVAGSAERMQQALSEQLASNIRLIGDALSKYLLTPLTEIGILLTNPAFASLLSGGDVLSGGAAFAAALAVNRAKGARDTRPTPAGTVRDPVTGDLVLSGTGLGGKPSGAATQELTDKAAAFAADIQAAVVKATDTLVDDLALAIGKIERQYRELSAGLTADQRRLIEGELNRLTTELALITKGESLTTGLTPGLASTTEGRKTPIRKDAEGLADATRDAADQAERYKREQEEADQRIQQARDHVRQQADAIERAARNAVILGEAFGLVDENVGKALEGIIQVGAELRVIAANGLNFDSVLGIGAGIVGIIGGLFGESADDKRDRAIREQNTEAIRELTKALITQVTGADAGLARNAIDALLGAGSGVLKGGGDLFKPDRGKINDVLKQFGLNLDELRELLKDINPNLTINTSSASEFFKSLQQIQQALEELNFRAFADSFAGQLQLLQDQFDLMDVTNPLEQLQAIAALAAQSSPVLKDLLTGIDLSSAAGRAEAEKRLLDVFKRLGLDTANGGFTAAELGNLSSQELRDLLKQIEALIDQTNEQQGTTGGPRQETFGVVRTITDTQADKLIGLGIGQLDTLVEIRDLVDDFASFVPVSPPGLPVLPFAGGLVIEQVTVNLGPGATADQAMAAGQAVIVGITEEADRQFGLRLTVKRSRFGNMVVR